MNRLLRGAWLLLVQLWLVGVLPLVHASQESAELRQGPVLAAESSATHGGECAVCALVSAARLAGDQPPVALGSELLVVHRPFGRTDHLHAAPSAPLGARAPPRS
jgi:hypothetical protein